MIDCFVFKIFKRNSRSTSLQLQENNWSRLCHQTILEFVRWWWMPYWVCGSGTVPRDQTSTERRNIYCLSAVSSSLGCKSRQAPFMGPKTQTDTSSRFIICRAAPEFILKLPNAMSPKRSPSRSKERRRRPSSHFHQEQQESAQQHRPPPPNTPLSLRISEDVEEKRVKNTNIYR